MSESNSNVIPAINAVDGFNPADFVRTTVGEEGENDLYLDVKYRLLWFRLHHPNGKIDPELIRVDEKNAIVCCRIYADKADPADQFIGKAYSQRFSTEDRFGDRFLEIAETVAKGRALADAGYGTQFCMNGETLASIIADAPIKMPPDEDAGHPGSVVASFTAQPTADAPVFSQAATAPKSTQPAQQQVLLPCFGVAPVDGREHHEHVVERNENPRHGSRGHCDEIVAYIGAPLALFDLELPADVDHDKGQTDVQQRIGAHLERSVIGTQQPRQQLRGDEPQHE